MGSQNLKLDFIKVPYAGKSFENSQILELNLSKNADQLEQNITKNLIDECDCVLFIWDSFAEKPSENFIELLRNSVKSNSEKSGVALNRVFYKGNLKNLRFQLKIKKPMKCVLIKLGKFLILKKLK